MNHEDEFVAVRVQDPRVQNEGLWNSYVDYKIFLHTNSKAFTAKTSCVRRRYSEFAWLKKKLQKNAGLVPVPDLPGKSFFSFSNEDFLERRRQGLQVFLDKVVNMTVCLSDSQLHLFLQTQLPVGHILDCVQGHTPYSVTDAILTYASSNRGWAQAQEEDAVIKEPSLNVSYESMESPAPHHPRPHNKDISSLVLSSCIDDDINEPCDTTARAETTPAIFYLGDGLDERTPPEDATHGSSRMETPVEVHSPGIEEKAQVVVLVSSSEVEKELVAEMVGLRQGVVSNEDAAQLSSSNESIVQVSDDEDVVNPNCLAPNGFPKMSPEDDSRWPRVSGGTAADLQVNGSSDRELSNSLDINFAENDFSVLESSSAPELAGGKHSPLTD
ncbi:sorting nexin-11 [Hippocampus comes]|uniref:sorting nexin-11 n=1 Tax=Hippocampus comes TaxID=109280 RepID=UPI00094E4F8A|nr:PREDICTED: sorting nexin-11 [Hippocampus comes]XP_019743377.1 PREDICTED: sorting nexin-11 [Hippocampus comes]XP_019743378.1 PREDICTED: sorting nexin-11 [Hippocampus comes]